MAPATCWGQVSKETCRKLCVPHSHLRAAVQLVSQHPGGQGAKPHILSHTQEGLV